MKSIISTVLVLGLLCSLVLAQQPPTKSGTAAPPPAKSGTMSPEKGMAPSKQPPAKASPSATENLVTYTFDGVRLEGDYYPAPEAKAKTTPCLILVHAVGLKHLTSSRADFGKLPERLQKAGYAVVAFDLRGYGKSKSVESKFWNTHTPRTRSLDVIEGKDFASSLELLEMIYDLTAIKIWLNAKNNSKECNSHTVGVIGIEQGGLIATAWAANEHTDPYRTKQRSNLVGNVGGFNNQGGFGNTGYGNPGFGNAGQFGNLQGNNLPRFEGEDITCIVSISTTNRLNDPVSYALLERWISFLRERQTATMAIYGANDKEASTFWSKAGFWAKPTTDKYRYKNAGTRPIKGTSLVGSKLLMNDTLDVGKVLEDYLQEAVKKTAESRLWAEQHGQDRPMPIDVQRLLR